MCYHHNGAVPSQKAIAEAKSTFAGRAVFGNQEERIYVRLASHNGAIYIDLCDDSWVAVRITAEGWQIVSDVPVKFIRAPGMRPLSTAG